MGLKGVSRNYSTHLDESLKDLKKLSNYTTPVIITNAVRGRGCIIPGIMSATVWCPVTEPIIRLVTGFCQITRSYGVTDLDIYFLGF